MSKFNFKEGDKVYCPTVTNKIVVVNSKLNIQYIGSTGDKNAIVVYRNGKWSDHHHNPIVFPATQEWYDRLSHVYPNLEKPPIKKSSKEVIQALLDDGNAGVVCWVSDSTVEPTSDNYSAIITGIDNAYTEHNTISWIYATPIMPIKSLNQIITDYVDGELILENANG